MRGVSKQRLSCFARRPAFYASAAFLLLAVSGCVKVGPDFETPPVAVEERWIEEEDPRGAQEPGEFVTGWQVFDDPLLTELVTVAVRQNLTLQSVGLRVIEARAALGIAIGEFYPQVQDAVGSYTYNKTSKNAPNNRNSDRTFQNLTVGIDATWELDLWGKFARNIEAADASLGATVANYDDFLVILTAEVARTYVVMREAEERERLARQNAELQRRTLDLTRVRFRAGAVTELDVQQARALLAETESSIPVFQIERRQAQNGLAVLLGVTPSQLREVLEPEGQIPAAPREVAVGIPAELLRRRPDIRQAELEAAAQSAQIGVARAQLFPALSLGGFAGLETSASVDKRSNGANLGDLFKEQSFTGFIGPSISWPILNYGRITNNVRVQDARFQGLIADYQNAVLEAYQEVEDGLIGFLRSQEQARFLVTSVEASKRAVDLALLQYREGIVDYQRVLDTQTALVNRQDNLAVSQSSIAQNLILTYRGLGGGWAIRGANEFVPEETIVQMQERTDWGGILPVTDVQDAPTSGAEASEVDTYFRSPNF